MATAIDDLEILENYEPPIVTRGRASIYRQYFVPGKAVVLRRGRDHGFVARDGGDRTIEQVRNSVKASAKHAGVPVNVHVEDEDTLVVVTPYIEDGDELAFTSDDE